ncbi:MAG TPA: nuclear transport factor 2 family protein [Chloroflexota bacterium]|jgi:ketosteroid isomerase-like protein
MTSDNDQIGRSLARWTAAEQSGDVAALDGCLADDFVGVGRLGFTLARADWLARHRAGELTDQTFQLAELQVRAYGAAAVVVARQTGQGAYRGQPVPSDLRATLVPVEQPGGWRLAGIPPSFIAGTPGAPAIPGRP